MKKVPTIIIGAQWGDEGKGKIVDTLSEKADIVVRFNGGNNAGHTIVYKGEKFSLSLIPSGVLWKKTLCLSQGVVISPKVLLAEIDFFRKRGDFPALLIDPRVNVVMPYHQLLDIATENSKGEKKVGSLKLGIGYCYEDRNNRHGIRVEDLINPKIFREKLFEEFSQKKKRIECVFGEKVTISADDIFTEYKKYGKFLAPFVADVREFIYQSWGKKHILFEGAHGTFLDANFGTYPYTTAVNTIAGSVFPYVGIPPQKIKCIGVVKAYTTRVGGGPFPTELFDRLGNTMQERGAEFGTVSKRRRRCGWLDMPMLKLSHQLNGFDSLAVTKLDVLSGIKRLKIATWHTDNGKKVTSFPSSLSGISRLKPHYELCTGWKEDISTVRKYKNLPGNCKKYLETIEKCLGIRISHISVGSERSATISL